MKQISSLEYNSLVWFIIRAAYIALSLSNLISLCYQDAWIGAILATILGIIPFMIFAYLKNYNPDLNIVQLNEKNFGFFGKIINTVMALAVLFTALMAFINLTNFIHSQFLFKTQTIYISLCFIIPILYALFKGINAISRTSLILFYIVIITIIFILIGVSSGIDLDNLKPMFSSPLIYGSSIMVAYNVLPLYFLLIIPKNKIKNHSSKKTFIFYLLSMISLINAVFITISVFGVELSLLYEYPEFHILKKVEIGEFVDRVENILSLEWIISLFIFIVMGLYFACESVRETFKLKTSNIIKVITCLIVLILSTNLFITHGTINSFFINKMLIFMYVSFAFIPIISILGCLLNKFHKHNTSTSKYNNY